MAKSFIYNVNKSNLTLIEFLNSVLDPVYNGFDVVTFNSDYTKPYNRELWTEDQCMAIKNGKEVLLDFS